MPSDAFLLVSYGSPECRDDVIPFLSNLFHGRDVSPARLEEVVKKAAAQYDEAALQTGQFSPLSQQCRLLVDRLRQRNRLCGPVYWGNLFWHPLLTDTLTEMQERGIRKATVFITSPFESEFSRKRYIDALENARNKIEIRLLPAFGNHPLYYRAVADRILEAASRITPHTRILFTAHSLPLSDQGTRQYVSQLNKAASELLPASLKTLPWELVFQSRGGKPSDPWLEPEILARIRQLAENRDQTGQPLSLLIVPVGFLLENKETVYDLDIQVLPLCDELRIPAVRVPTAGSLPSILEMIEQMG